MLSAAILLARVLGLAQLTITSWLMPQADTDAYTTAFRITDFVNYLIAGGALSATFIPVFTQFKDNGRQAEAWRFFSAVASIMSLALLAVLGAMYVFAYPLADFATRHAYSPEKLALTVQMARIMLPAQACFYLGGLLVGVLNAYKRFGASGMTGAVYNLVAIIVGVALWFVLSRKSVAFASVGFAWGILLGAFCGGFLLPLLAVMRGPRAERVRFQFLLSLRAPGIATFFRNSLPIMLGVSFPVVDQIVMPYFTASLPDGTLTQLDRGNRVMVAALAILAQAASVAAFPYLASDSATGKWKSFAEFLRNGLRRLIFIALPASTLLILLAPSIIWVLLRHGKFSAQAAQHSAIAFAFYCVGMFAWTGQQLVARALYAMQDTKTPTIIGSALTIFFFLPLCALAASSKNPILALALVTSIGACAHFGCVLVALERKLRQPKYNIALRSERILGTLLRTLVACLAMGSVGLMAKNICDAFLPQNFGAHLLRIVVIPPFAIGAFLWAARRIHIPELDWLMSKLKRRKTA